MIEAVTVERFRGLRQLEIEGFGRVNLIIGKNDCGKTALMEAVSIVDCEHAAAHVAIGHQNFRRPHVPEANSERFWLPLFWNHQDDQGFAIAARSSVRGKIRVEFRKGKTPSTVLAAGATRWPREHTTWAINMTVTGGPNPREEEITATPDELKIPAIRGEGAWDWIRARPADPDSMSGLVRAFSELKRTGDESRLLETLRVVDPRVVGAEILAPTGNAAEIFVRLEPATPFLPIQMMGEGFQRCFELAVSAEINDWPTLFIDEFENGLHHSVLEPVWSRLATISKQRNLQVFATTHSEECIHAASRAFTAMNDEGLRVIRLDRRKDETMAAIYDRALVETTAEAGIEIRG